MKILNIVEEKTKGILHLFSIIYLDKSGKKRKWELCSRKNKHNLERELFDGYLMPDGVMIVATHQENNKLVILQEFRVAINDYLYTFPGGIVENNENMFEATKREFKEETGMEIVDIDYSKGIKPRYSSVGLTNEKISIIYATCKGLPDNEMLGNNEQGKIKLIDVNEAQRILNEEKIAGKTELILQNYIYECRLNKVGE